MSTVASLWLVGAMPEPAQGSALPAAAHRRPPHPRTTTTLAAHLPALGLGPSACRRDRRLAALPVPTRHLDEQHEPRWHREPVTSSSRRQRREQEDRHAGLQSHRPAMKHQDSVDGRTTHRTDHPTACQWSRSSTNRVEQPRVPHYLRQVRRVEVPLLGRLRQVQDHVRHVRTSS